MKFLYHLVKSTGFHFPTRDVHRAICTFPTFSSHGVQYVTGACESSLLHGVLVLGTSFPLPNQRHLPYLFILLTCN